MSQHSTSSYSENKRTARKSVKRSSISITGMSSIKTSNKQPKESKLVNMSRIKLSTTTIVSFTSKNSENSGNYSKNLLMSPIKKSKRHKPSEGKKA